MTTIEKIFKTLVNGKRLKLGKVSVGKLLAVFLSVFILLTNVSFSFADSTTKSFYQFSPSLKSTSQLRTSYNFSSLSTDSTNSSVLCTFGDGAAETDSRYAYVISSFASPVYCFFYQNGTQYACVFASKTYSNSAVGYRGFYSTPQTSFTLASTDSSTGLSYYLYDSSALYSGRTGIPSLNFPLFTSFSAGMSALKSYIDSLDYSGVIQLSSSYQDLGGYLYDGIGLQLKTDSSVPVYATGYFVNSESTQSQVVLATQFDPSEYPFSINRQHGGSATVYSSSQFTYDSLSQLYYFSPGQYEGNQSYPLVGGYTGLSSALSAIDLYISSLSSSSSSFYEVQNGYLTVIDIGNGNSYDLTLISYSERLSNFFTNKFTYANQSYWFGSSLPVEGYEFPPSNAVIVDWNEGSPKTVSGQSHNMVAQLSGTASSRYLFIYNPVGYQDPDINAAFTSALEYNNSMTISGLLPNTHYYIYNSSGVLTLDVGGVQGTISGTEYGVGVSSSSGGISYPVSSDDSSSVYIQTSGGDTSTSGLVSIQGYLNSLVNTLDSFVDNFLSLLSAPISHIQQLISAGNNFATVLSGLFSWLPSDVSSIFVSAIVVMIVIGVLKLLL